jgi:outer membrane protein assembly factor BamB
MVTTAFISSARAKSFLSLSLLFSLLFFTSCKDDEDNPTNPGVGGGSADYTIHIQGSVLAEDGSFIAGATVAFDGETVITDSRGVFQLRNVSAREGRNFVKVTKTGYYPSGKNIYVIDNEAVSMKLRLMPRLQTGTFQGASGGTITTADGMSVSIPAGAFEGNYQGEVRVFTRYVDPTQVVTGELIPGLEAQNANGDLGILRSYGMGQFEFEDQSGNLLDLAEGQIANLIMPIPADVQGAPPTIPLWYFDDEMGIWIEEGTATLNGNVYEGEVSHFTFWNCDDFGCDVPMRINISCGGSPFPNLPVILKIVGVGPTGIASGVTGFNGAAITNLPCNSETEVYIIPNGSTEEEYIGTIVTTVQGDTYVEDANLDAICGPHATVAGTVVKADMRPVTNGYAYLQYDEFFTEPVFFDDEGAFFAGYYSFDESFWQEEADIIVWDLDNFSTATGPSVPFNVELNILPKPIVIGGDVAVTNGRIYLAGTNDYGIYCLDAANGNLIWSRDEGPTEREVSPLFYENRLYIRMLSGEFFCYNGFDGSEIWSSFNSDGNSPVSDNQGLVFTNSLGGTLKAWDFNDGSTVWSTNLGANTSSDMTILNDRLYMGRRGEGALVALDKETGEVEWEYITGSWVNASPCIADGRIFFAADNQEFYALNVDNGNFLWQATIDDGPYFWGSPATGQGLVFVQSVNHVRAFDQASGVEQWEYSILSSSGGEEPYYWNGKLYVSGSSNGSFVCLDATTGAEIWELDPPGTGEIANYFVVVEGVLYMQRHEAPHTLQARNANTGEVLWTSEVPHDLDAPMVVVDDTGQAHHCTLSGMHQ